jgi:hypothetical protein
MRRYEGFGFEDICRGNIYFPRTSVFGGLIASTPFKQGGRFQDLFAFSLMPLRPALLRRQHPVIESSKPGIEQAVMVIMENA